jgi:hypothetical protein
VVNAERARLTREIENAELQISRFERAADALEQLRTRQRAEYDQVLARAGDARALAEQVTASKAATLRQEALVDGREYVETQARLWATSREGRSAGALMRRRAERSTARAALDFGVVEKSLTDRWGSVPLSVDSLQRWADAVAQRRADVQPEVMAAAQYARERDGEQRDLADRHSQERDALRRELTGSQTGRPGATRRQWRLGAARARADLLELQAIPVERAAQLLEERSGREVLAHTARRMASLLPAGRSSPDRVDREL